MTLPATTAPPPVRATRAITQRRSFLAYLFETAAVNWIASAMSIVYALVITPIVIRALRAELYGVWSFLNGLLAYSNLFYFGLGAAFVRYLALSRAAGEHDRVNRLTSVVFGIYTLIGVACAVICLGLSGFVPALFAGTLSADAAREAATACVLLGTRLFFMFVATVFSGVLNAEERLPVSSKIYIGGTVARFIAVPLMLPSQSPLVTLAVIMSVSAALEALALAVTAFMIVPGLRIGLSVPSASELRLLYGFGLKSFFILASAWLINYTDTTVIGITLGATAVAIYSVALQLTAYGRVLIEGMVAALLPRLTAYETSGQRAQLKEMYLRGTRGTGYIAAFIALNLITLGPAFTALWVGGTYANGGRIALIALALAGYCQAVSTQMTVPFYQAINALKVPVLVLAAEGAANLMLSLWAVARFGISGVAVATLVPALVVSSTILPLHLSRVLALSRRTLVVSALFPSISLLAIGLLTNYVVGGVLPLGSYAALAIRGVGNAVLAWAVATAVLPAEDLRVVYSVVPWIRPFRPAAALPR